VTIRAAHHLPKTRTPPEHLRVKHPSRRHRQFLARASRSCAARADRRVRVGRGYQLLRLTLERLIGYRHGLRASELCNLQWSQVELTTGRLHVRRAKNGSPSVHPMQGDEIRALRRLQREQGLSSHAFMTERDGPMTPKAFHALFGRIGERAKMQFPIHPHMLRHGCGYALANAGHDTRALQAWLGHRNIQHTVRYTELAPDRFKNFWRD
jgi:integrase